MPHDTPLISMIVAGVVVAFIFGAIAHRFKVPPIVGYLLAGVVCGPFTPGFVADPEIATELSEIGVILLMFGVGLHFSLKDLLSVRAVAIPGAIVQIAGATAMGLALGLALGWSMGAGLLFGLALSTASTVVVLKTMQDRRLVDSERGRVAIGWLIVEDIIMVLALVLIPAVASLNGATDMAIHDPFVASIERLTGWQLNLFGILVVTVIKLAAFVGFMLVVGRRVIPAILHRTAHTGSRELFRLAVLAIALGVAAGASYLFGVSLALGAFFAGMILSESELSQRAANETLPLRDAFAVLFFVSVGMLFDPMTLITNPVPLLATVGIIIFGKTILSFLIMTLFRQAVGTSLTISASLAQIGEFSFILAALGVGLGILPGEGRDLILGGSIISILLNPLVFAISERLAPRLQARGAGATPSIILPERVEPGLATGVVAPLAAAREEENDEPVPTTLRDHAVLVGYGRVGVVVAGGLKQQGTPFVVIEDAEDRVVAARAAGFEVAIGNAASPETLALANVLGAKVVLIAIPNVFEAGQAVEQCRKLNAHLAIVARAHSDEEISYLRELGANEVITGDREIGLGMVAWTNGEVAQAVEAPSPEPSPEPTSMSLPAAPQLVADAVAETRAEEDPAVIVVSPVAIEALEAEIEAAHPAHEIVGPAEPAELVPALGEMLEGDEVAEVLPDVIELPPAAKARAAAPSRLPGVAFTPELPGEERS
jgi:CPA2 family monovalent cation:H+ antiporter-2